MYVQTGTMKSDDVQLALYRYYVDATDRELDEAKVTRAEVLTLARTLDQSSEYRQTELTTIATQVLAAFCAGRKSK